MSRVFGKVLIILSILKCRKNSIWPLNCKIKLLSMNNVLEIMENEMKYIFKTSQCLGLLPQSLTHYMWPKCILIELRNDSESILLGFFIRM